MKTITIRHRGGSDIMEATKVLRSLSPGMDLITAVKIVRDRINHTFAVHDDRVEWLAESGFEIIETGLDATSTVTLKEFMVDFFSKLPSDRERTLKEWWLTVEQIARNQ